jgi:hypothetical protein
VFTWIHTTFERLEEEELEMLKDEVFKYINLLVEIDSSATSKLIKIWFSDSRDLIIAKLDNAPKLQIKYLGK